MLYRKISKEIEQHLLHSDKIMMVQGARQVGKSYIIRDVCRRLFKNYAEVNLADDRQSSKSFAQINDTESLYLQLSASHGDSLGAYEDTVVFLDEIQEYPHLISMLKQLRAERRYHFIASGSLLGVTLRKDTFIPIGSIAIKDMHPLDFEEFLLANGVGDDVLEEMKAKFMARESLGGSLHDTLLGLFRKYLICGGLPDNVNMLLDTYNITALREQQNDIMRLYADDAARYEQGKKLKIRRIYGMIPSKMGSVKKRVVFRDIDGNANRRFDDFAEEFDYLIDSGIALSVNAISNPHFPLVESEFKNLLKLYLNDVGLLTGILYGNNIRAILDDVRSINLGSVYETVVAQELKAHRHSLFYYDNKSHGEVDFLIDDYDSLSVKPIEIKSGKDYTTHSALSHFIDTPDYGIKSGVVLSNERLVETCGKVTYLPIYFVPFL